MASPDQPPRRVRLGVIGAGLALKRLHWPALQRLADRFAVAAIANTPREGAAWLADAAGLALDCCDANYDDLLRRDDIEAVLIALPIPLLYPAARAALEAGKHVVCEKPSGVDLDEGRAFLALAEAFPSRKILIAENSFYRDDLRLARARLDAGAIGQVHLLAWHAIGQLVPREGRFSSTPWRQTPAYRGGPQLDAGVHHIAQLRLLCGEVQDLQAYTREVNPTTGGPSDLTLNLRFTSGVIGSYVAGYLPIPTPGETTELRLYGSDGVMAVGWRTLRLSFPNGSTETYRVEADGGYANELRNFYEAIIYDEPIVGTIAQSYQNLEIVMRALDSAAEGRLVALDAAPDGAASAGVPLWKPRGADGLFDGLPCRVSREEAS